MTPEQTTMDPATVAEPRRTDSDEPTIALFAEQQIADLRRRWDEIQAAFIDEPRAAVEKADKLVAEAISQLTEAFGRTRAQLDGQWHRGDAVSTEDLRQALRHYRSFFARVLKT
jgi:hypothetical protein